MKVRETSAQQQTSISFMQRFGLRTLLFLLETWLGSCRESVIGHDRLYRFLDQKCPVIATLWHMDILYLLYHFRAHKAAIMVSGSKDGEWVARALRIWGQMPVRGSRMKGGLKAIKEITNLVRDKGYNAGIVADGSKGPALRAQIGAIILSRDTGAPILPMGFGASRVHRFNSWDRTNLPWPFSHVAVVYGEPIYVSQDARGARIEYYRDLLERGLNEVNKRALEAVKGF